MDNIVCGRCSVGQIIKFKDVYFQKNRHVFRHLKLDIALAIPASNDEKQKQKLLQYLYICALLSQDYHRFMY